MLFSVCCLLILVKTYTTHYNFLPQTAPEPPTEGHHSAEESKECAFGVHLAARSLLSLLDPISQTDPFSELDTQLKPWRRMCQSGNGDAKRAGRWSAEAQCSICAVKQNEVLL